MVSLLVGAAFMDLRWNREYLRLRQVELAGLHALDRKLAATEDVNAQMEQRVIPFRTAVENGDVLRLALQAVIRAKDPDDWLSLLADAEAYFGTSTTPDAEAPTEQVATSDDPMRFETFIVEGYTPVADFSTVGQMIERLRTQPGIIDADLLGDERLRHNPERDARWEDTGCSAFVIEMTVEVP